MDSKKYHAKFSELYKECITEMFSLLETHNIDFIDVDELEDDEAPYATFSSGSEWDEVSEYQHISKIEVKYLSSDEKTGYDVIAFTGSCGHKAYVDRFGGGEFFNMDALPFIYEFIYNYVEKYEKH